MNGNFSGFIVQAVSAMCPIVFLVALGYVLSRRRWFDAKSEAMIARLVTSVALPCSIFISLSRNFTAETLTALLPDTVLPVASMFLAMVIGKIAARVLNIRHGRRGVFSTNFFISNTMFIGLPVNLALFGEESIPAVMLYYVVNTLIFWTLGVNNIVGDTARARESLFSPATLQKILSPSLCAFFVSIAFVMSGLSLPDGINAGLRYTGQLTTPLSLIFIGIEISHISIRHFKFEKDLAWGLVGRYVVCPLCVLLLVPFIKVSPMSVKVFTMQAAMPAMTMLTIVSKQYGADSQYAAALSFVTILMGMIVIPLYMTVVNLYV